MAQKHYIGMAGIRGCLPSTCDVYDTAGEAAESLGQLHDLEDDQIAKLARDHFLSLPEDAGNEYAEIIECTCDDPSVHSDNQ